MNRVYFLASVLLMSSAAMAQSASISLSARATAATHSIHETALVVPVESGLKDVASHTIPGYAIQFLELKAQ